MFVYSFFVYNVRTDQGSTIDHVDGDAQALWDVHAFFPLLSEKYIARDICAVVFLEREESIANNRTIEREGGENLKKS